MKRCCFPELEPAGDTKLKLGDVFYKIWWIYLKPLVPNLQRGQALHAVRHAVSDELKEQEVFIEHRNDLLGHQSAGGEGATRYPSAASLSKLKGLVDRIPVVTDHLQDVRAEDIRLLSNENRKRRPSRRG